MGRPRRRKYEMELHKSNLENTEAHHTVETNTDFSHHTANYYCGQVVLQKSSDFHQQSLYCQDTRPERGMENRFPKHQVKSERGAYPGPYGGFHFGLRDAEGWMDTDFMHQRHGRIYGKTAGADYSGLNTMSERQSLSSYVPCNNSQPPGCYNVQNSHVSGGGTMHSTMQIQDQGHSQPVSSWSCERVGAANCGRELIWSVQVKAETVPRSTFYTNTPTCTSSCRWVNPGQNNSQSATVHMEQRAFKNLNSPTNLSQQQPCQSCYTKSTCRYCW